MDALNHLLRKSSCRLTTPPLRLPAGGVTIKSQQTAALHPNKGGIENGIHTHQNWRDHRRPPPGQGPDPGTAGRAAGGIGPSCEQVGDRDIT